MIENIKSVAVLNGIKNILLRFNLDVRQSQQDDGKEVWCSHQIIVRTT